MDIYFYEKMMRRCFDLAQMGKGFVSPNPIVGAVVVYKKRVIGEGWHQIYGEAHAEVNAIASIAEEDEKFLPESTIFVSLEPCCIFGNTPPCANLFLEKKIPKVVISCLDLTPGVAGNSVQLLRDAGVEVITGILEEEGKQVATIRNTFVNENRPYIVLKFAQSEDGFMGKKGEQIWLTNPYSKRLVHKWRSELDAILVGTNTAETDNPQLNNRYWSGLAPLRLVLDRQARLPQDLYLFDDEQPTLIFTEKDMSLMGFNQTRYMPLDFSDKWVENLLDFLKEGNISSILVEGGARTIQSFVDAGLWDEARIFTTNKRLGEGIQAPKLRGEMTQSFQLIEDKLTVLKNNKKPEKLNLI